MEANAKLPRSPIGAFFAHPASLLLIGGALTALLSGLLVPYVTRSWQNHDKELQGRSAILHEELGAKSHLVNLIGGATANFLGASQLHPYAEAGKSARLSDYDRAYVRWSISSAEIASQLAAYFPDSSAGSRWRDFTQLMRNSYYLVRDHPGDERSEWLKMVQRYLPTDSKVGNAILDRPLHGTLRNQTYEGALRRLLLEIEKRERLIVSVIVRSPSALRQTSLFSG